MTTGTNILDSRSIVYMKNIIRKMEYSRLYVEDSKKRKTIVKYMMFPSRVQVDDILFLSFLLSFSQNTLLQIAG